jgi:6-phosphofructokinase 2
VAEKIGAKAVLDTSGEALQVAMDKDGIHHPFYLLKPNIRELAQLAGVEMIESEEHQEEAARSLIATGKTEAVIVSLGRGGAMLVNHNQATHYRAPTVPMKSAVGAGDSMVGGIVLKLAQGGSLEDAARYGIAAGSAAVMTEGTRLCRLEDTEHLYDRITQK